jgi:hypothetical protein
MIIIDLTGKRFGRLAVVGQNGTVRTATSRRGCALATVGTTSPSGDAT